MNKSPGNIFHRKRHRLLHYIINTDNIHQNLANFVVDTTFFSNHAMKEKMNFSAVFPCIIQRFE